MSPSTVFGTALSWALVAAIAHVSAVLFRVHVLRGFTMTTQWFPVTAPLMYGIIFCLIAVPLSVAARLGWRVVSVRAVNSLFAGLSVFSILLLYRRIHPLSYAVVAVGVGWQVGEWLTRHPLTSKRLTRYAAPALAVILAVIGMSPLAMTSWREWAAMRRSREAAGDAPNVLLLILDTVRAANLGAYGYHRSTSPSIDSLAREGVLFEHAYSTASWSLPSHASMLTGLWAHETGANYLRRIQDTLPTVTEVMRQRGYMTGAFIANAGWAGHETGLSRGFHRYTTYRHDLSQLLWSTSLTQTPMVQGIINGLVTRSPARIMKALWHFDLQAKMVTTAETRRAGEITDAFLTWRDRIGNRHPWFATLNMFDAHDPYRTPFEGRYDDGRTSMDRYDGAIAYVDSMVGRLVTALELRGDLDQTLIIVTSDHGEKFGEHGEYAHSGGLYLPVVHVPLLVRHPPHFPPGARRADLVTLADIPATILEVLGAPDAVLPGKSLVRPPSPDDELPVVLFLSSRRINTSPDDRTSAGDVLGALTNEWHFMRFADGAEELYRWREDPAETTNLAGSPEAQAVLPDLRSLLTSSSKARGLR
jgi:arylsulfatase A-like enzyme